MPPPESAVRIEAIRAAVRLAIAEKSLRAVAREVGLSPMGLSNFLNGRQPYTATRRKLTLWYAEHGAQLGAHEDAVRAALDILLEGLPAKGRERGVGVVLDVVERMHRESRTQPPAWLGTLRRDGSGEGGS
ncbi:MAG TPA: hypothetical protein VFS20_09510 [Longimicrobium sp.]|nr:hypothetical protein [Longimicrobium sp.]